MHTSQIRTGRSARESAPGKGWTLGTWSDRINEKQLDDKSAGAGLRAHDCRGQDLYNSQKSERINISPSAFMQEVNKAEGVCDDLFSVVQYLCVFVCFCLLVRLMCFA